MCCCSHYSIWESVIQASRRAPATAKRVHWDFGASGIVSAGGRRPARHALPRGSAHVGSECSPLHSNRTNEANGCHDWAVVLYGQYINPNIIAVVQYTLRWRLVGNRWQLVGNRWRLVGNRWQLEGKRWGNMQT